MIFPDGRVGAWINVNDEIAYLTFVLDPENSHWLIDAWDDRELDLAATPEP